MDKIYKNILSKAPKAQMEVIARDPIETRIASNYPENDERC